LNSNRPANGSVPVLLGEFPQADIQGALATCAAEAHNVIIGTIQGTFGPFTLSAVYDGPNADPVCSLQINAFESEGKESKPYGFAPKADGSYSPVPQPVAEQPAAPAHIGVCNGADIGDTVVLLGPFPTISITNFQFTNSGVYFDGTDINTSSKYYGISCSLIIKVL
jgi:hypothetical protein